MGNVIIIIMIFSFNTWLLRFFFCCNAFDYRPVLHCNTSNRCVNNQHINAHQCIVVSTKVTCRQMTLFKAIIIMFYAKLIIIILKEALDLSFLSYHTYAIIFVNVIIENLIFVFLLLSSSLTAMQRKVKHISCISHESLARCETEGNRRLGRR